MNTPFQHPAQQEIGSALAALEARLRIMVMETYAKAGLQIPVSITEVVTDVTNTMARLRSWRPGEGSFLEVPANRAELAGEIRMLSDALPHYEGDPVGLELHLSEIRRVLDTAHYLFSEGE